MILLASIAAAGIDWTEPPVEGVAVVLQVTHEDGSPAAGETVRVTHHPTTGQPIERAINISDARGRVTWTPEVGGLADLRAGVQERRVRIAPAGLPIVVIVLNVILFLTFSLLVALGVRRRT